MGIIKDPKSWRAGFELGLAGFSFPYSKPRKPTAYLYNGIRLPALPEWDRGVYPFAYITAQSGGTSVYYYLHARSVPFTVLEGSGGTLKYLTLKGTSVITNGPILDKWDNAFTGPVNYDNGDVEATCPDIIWTNFDICYADGTVYMAASDPVPVYD